MLAVKKHMTLGNVVLESIRSHFPKNKTPNKLTIAAHKDALEGKGTLYNSADEFWDDMMGEE